MLRALVAALGYLLDLKCGNLARALKKLVKAVRTLSKAFNSDKPIYQQVDIAKAKEIAKQL